MMKESKRAFRRLVKPLAFLISLLIWVIMGIMPAGLQPAYSQAGSNLSLRLFGNGTGFIDRVEITIDPQVPADIGATNFTLEWWMKASLAENSSPGASCGSEAGWISGNILLDRDIFGPGDYRRLGCFGHQWENCLWRKPGEQRQHDLRFAHRG